MRTVRIATASCAAGVLSYAGIMAVLSLHRAAVGGAKEPPAFIELTGVVRDFKERTAEGGHTDFERVPDHGFAHYSGSLAPYLGDGRKPVFTSNGSKVKREWKDAEGRPICYLLYDPDLGDQKGRFGPTDNGGIESGGSFDMWYRDVLGVNMSAPLTLTFIRQDDGSYVFDDELDPTYQDLDGFFPIEGQLFGNPGGDPDRNFHFTFELHATFDYDASGGQIFKFIGDDDVWVYVDDRLVIDLGGVHGATEQYVDLNRLGLQDGETYTLDFFFAERHRTQSNFRIVTNLHLETSDRPTFTSIYD
ncbi:MAG: fibro-slime domain-containing protein [Planctomycetota bacterium]|jgi:fibro-slime domain-containing protein